MKSSLIRRLALMMALALPHPGPGARVLVGGAERRLGGWLYSMFRPTIGTVAGGVWVWDDTAHLPWDVLYSTNFTSLRLPDDTDFLEQMYAASEVQGFKEDVSDKTKN